ncbi:MAG: carboxypeptidase regulatory-like domain-containing protein [Planctomycetaceae bacterium]|nr:carboxypeptidase regulatory-like domain-containing protein [Planctomycetaceae bacterium]
MFKTFISPFVAMGLLLAATLSGCGGGDDHPERPDRAEVSGTVTYKGEPIDKATVSFHPEAADGKAAFAITDAEGKFVMGTFETRDGVVAGTYHVTVTKMESTSAAQVSQDDPNYNPNPPPSVSKSLLPKKYSDPSKSGLQVTIDAEPIKDLKFELVD